MMSSHTIHLAVWCPAHVADRELSGLRRPRVESSEK